MIKFLISPLYLLPALLGILFYNFTREKLIIDRKLYKEFRRPDGSIHFPLEMRPFWGKVDSHPYLLFLVPGFNIPLIIVLIIHYFLSNKATQSYLKNYDPIKELKGGDKEEGI